MEPSATLLDRLLGLHPKLIDLSLGRIERLLDRLGRPQDRLPPAIHVAGTNGKGSTIAFLRAICEAAGLRVHTYTSPHLVHFHERIRVAGTLISEEALAAALERVEDANDGAPITFFEITTAAAFLAFSDVPADVALIEVGLGGRLDATNVMTPAVSVITPVDFDHQEFLGSTIAAIAGEKAGIIKAGVPAVIARQQDDGWEVMRRIAAKRRAVIFAQDEDWTIRSEQGRLVYEDDAGLIDLPLPRLKGAHQIDNAGLAIAALRRFKPQAIPPAALEQGMIRAEWPARFQRLTRGPLQSDLPPGSELWLDGAHNPSGARALATLLADMQERAERPVDLVVGLLSTKDAEGFFTPFEGLVRTVTTVPVPTSLKTMDPEALAEIARHHALPAATVGNVPEAIQLIRRAWEDEDGPPPRIVVTGSLYLAGSVLRDNG